MPTLAEYRLECRRLLHDASGKFWSDSELNDYINDARTRVCSDTACLRELVTAYLTTGKEAYSIGQVTGATIVSGGTGYVSPTVSFTGGGGSGAAATLTVVNGVITAITFTSYGSGYTTAPTATILPAVGSVASIDVFSAGADYDSSAGFPSITFSSGGGAGAVAFPVMRASTEDATTGTGGTGYQQGDILTAVGGTFTSPARWVVLSTSGPGIVSQVALIDGGAYSAYPATTFATTGGVGAGCQLSTFWQVGSVNVTQGGSGYTFAPIAAVIGGGATVGAILTVNLGASGAASIVASVLPDDTLDIMNVTPIWGNQRVPLNYMPFTEFNAKWRTWLSNPSLPRCWSKYGTSGAYSSYVQPIPDQTYTAEFDTAILPQALLIDTTEDEIRFPYSAAVAYYACWKAKIKQQAFAESESFSRDYKMKVLEAQAAQQMRRIPNPYAGYSGG